VKKLKIEELHVESFATSSITARRGTVVAHQTYDAACTYSNYTACLSCGSGCTATAEANCTTDPTDTRSQESICYTAVECSENSCTGPYGCACTKTESFDYTFCNDTMCC
jgi:hypothetical protein